MEGGRAVHLVGHCQSCGDNILGDVYVLTWQLSCRSISIEEFTATIESHLHHNITKMAGTT